MSNETDDLETLRALLFDKPEDESGDPPDIAALFQIQTTEEN